jgi:hypothetical protein
MTYILIRTLICLAIMAAVFIGLVVIGCLSPRERNRVMRVLMFSSRDEADRAAAIAASNHDVIAWPQYVSDVHRYFVVIEEAPAGLFVARRGARRRAPRRARRESSRSGQPAADRAKQSLVEKFSAVLAHASPFLISPFKPCVPFSGTRLNDDLLGVACAGYFTVPINLCRPIPQS